MRPIIRNSCIVNCFSPSKLCPKLKKIKITTKISDAMVYGGGYDYGSTGKLFVYIDMNDSNKYMK